MNSQEIWQLVDEAKKSELREAAECVVATAFGNTSGLTDAEQLQAIRMACEGLKDALGQ